MDTVSIHTPIMDTAGTHTATTDTVDRVTIISPVMDTAMAADQGTSGVRAVGDKRGYGSRAFLIRSSNRAHLMRGSLE
jgi:hypothetical protein